MSSVIATARSCLGWALFSAVVALGSVCCADGGRAWHDPYTVELERVREITAGVHGLAFAPDGSLFLADSYRNQGPLSMVYRLAAGFEGELETTPVMGDIVSGLYPEGDDLYVCFTGEDRIALFDSEFVQQSQWSVPVPWNVIRLGQDLIAVTYDGQVRRLLDDGTSQTLFSGLEYPFDLAPGAEDTLWVSEQVEADRAGRVSRFKLDGSLVEELGYHFDNPEGLALDDRSALYIADTSDPGSIVRRLPDGQVELVSRELYAPITFARAPGGDLYFNTSGSNAGLYRLRLSD